MSGDLRRGATIRRSIMPDTALAFILGSTWDCTSAVGAAGATAAGVWAGARTGSAALCFFTGASLFVSGVFFNRYGFRGVSYAGGFGGRGAWQHDASHRLGVSYPNGQLASRYGGALIA